MAQCPSTRLAVFLLPASCAKPGMAAISNAIQIHTFFTCAPLDIPSRFLPFTGIVIDIHLTSPEIPQLSARSNAVILLTAFAFWQTLNRFLTDSCQTYARYIPDVCPCTLQGTVMLIRRNRPLGVLNGLFMRFIPLFARFFTLGRSIHIMRSYAVALQAGRPADTTVLRAVCQCRLKANCGSNIKSFADNCALCERCPENRFFENH